MGFPAEGQESMYRNPMNEVQRFFRTYHKNHFKVYNLCIEKDRQYPASKFTECGGEVAKYGFKDHNAPELELILEFCKDVHEFLGRSRENVVAIHCKAGKGRTGVMICAYLVYAKICRSAEEALRKYGEARTFNAKGVTIPSQRRYVFYFSNYVLNPVMTPIPDRFSFYKIVILKRIRMNTIPNFDVGGGCDPYFLILNTKGEILYDYSQHNPVKPQRSKKAMNKKRKSKKYKNSRSLLSKVNKNREDNNYNNNNTNNNTDREDSFNIREDSYIDQKSVSKQTSSHYGANSENTKDASGNKDKGPPPMSLAEFFAQEKEQEFVKFGDLDIILRGSFKIVFYDKDVLSSDDIMCWTWCHSAICASEKYIRLERDLIDGAVKDKKMKHFNDEFSLEFWFDTPLDSSNKKDQELSHYHTDTQPRLFDQIDLNLLNQGKNSPIKFDSVEEEILGFDAMIMNDINNNNNYNNNENKNNDEIDELMNSIDEIEQAIGIVPKNINNTSNSNSKNNRLNSSGNVSKRKKKHSISSSKRSIIKTKPLPKPPSTPPAPPGSPMPSIGTTSQPHRNENKNKNENNMDETGDTESAAPRKTTFV